MNNRCHPEAVYSACTIYMRSEIEKDNILLNQIAGGDESAFRKLLQQWYPLLTNYIFRITRSRNVAEEIAQDIFLKIWETRRSLGQVKYFKLYLWKISRNHAINQLRKTMREIRHQRSWARDQDAGSIHAIADGEGSYLALLDRAIDSLPPRRKQVYLLHRYQGLTYQEIALRLGISKETVKTHIKLAVHSITIYCETCAPEILSIFILFFLNL
jgi:RNA polymerase sigma-70 factor (family 1)